MFKFVLAKQRSDVHILMSWTSRPPVIHNGWVLVCIGDACEPESFWKDPCVEHIRFDYIEHHHPAWIVGYLCRIIKRCHRFCDQHCLESRQLIYFKPQQVQHYPWWVDARDTFNVYGYCTHTSHGGIRLRHGPIHFPFSLWGFPYAFVEEEVMAENSNDNEDTLGQPFTVELG